MTILEVLNLLQIKYPESAWTLPPDPKLGVLTTNYAFLKAKTEKNNPVAISTQIVGELNEYFVQENLALEAKNVGPYINVQLLPAGLTELVAKSADTNPSRQDSVTTSPEANLDIENSKGVVRSAQSDTLVQRDSLVKLNRIHQSFVIDMFHPNVGKKMHVGHIRSANLGESMRRILSLKYDRVIADCYLGDWGIQFSYTTWGILHLPELGLEFNTIDLDTEERAVLVEKFYKIYVRMNQLIEEKPEIRVECQRNSKLLEAGMQGAELDSVDQEKFEFLHDLYRRIVTLSLVQFKEGEAFLNINRNPEWLELNQVLIPADQIERVKGKTGCHYSNSTHIQGQFDLTLGESFYISFLSEMHVLADNGLAVREGEAIYVDLEAEKLGRAYLISSEGYSLYHTRDIICRMVYAGIFGFDNAITFADLRQAHSFKQVFAVLRRIIDSRIYENRPFGWMTIEETQRALNILDKKMAMFEGFGHLNLPDGAMSTRKGKIFAFEDLKSMLVEKVRTTLSEKNPEDELNEDKIRKIAVASLKWVDMHRDREQDAIFDPNQFLKFEGNTGVYQLYTLVRLNSILANNSAVNFESVDFDVSKLNEEEVLLLRQAYTLPIVLENVIVAYKPHHLCSYLFELATKINSWYVKYNVSTEPSEVRKKTLLVLCRYLRNHLELALSLLGIESVEDI